MLIEDSLCDCLLGGDLAAKESCQTPISPSSWTTKETSVCCWESHCAGTQTEIHPALHLLLEEKGLTKLSCSSVLHPPLWGPSQAEHMGPCSTSPPPFQAAAWREAPPPLVPGRRDCFPQQSFCWLLIFDGARRGQEGAQRTKAEHSVTTMGRQAEGPRLAWGFGGLAGERDGGSLPEKRRRGGPRSIAPQGHKLSNFLDGLGLG